MSSKDLEWRANIHGVEEYEAKEIEKVEVYE